MKSVRNEKTGIRSPELKNRTDASKQINLQRTVATWKGDNGCISLLRFKINHATGSV